MTDFTATKIQTDPVTASLEFQPPFMTPNLEWIRRAETCRANRDLGPVHRAHFRQIRPVTGEKLTKAHSPFREVKLTQLGILLRP
jgi:hypothetical protein